MDAILTAFNASTASALDEDNIRLAILNILEIFKAYLNYFQWKIAQNEQVFVSAFDEFVFLSRCCL